MTKRKRTPQAPPAAAGRRKKAQETPEEASGAGPSQPPSSRPKRGAKRGGPKEPVDPTPERNSRNHPYSGIYPRAVDSFSSVSLAVQWLTRFTHWLTTWTENVLPTVDFVRAHRQHMDGIFESITVLHEFWGETPQPIDRHIIWSDVPSAVRDILLTEWPHFYQHAEVAATRVEEAPPVEGAPVEEATRVEEAPGQETTLVEKIYVGIPIPAEAIPLGATQE
ncbi:hypothetical protein R1sor_017765 [Riccia sorocarpa]|uniref:Uncharacterized protein n=1 Tax=Riccia sorocarpa TaxID=122646 RepID=A0ABD3I7Z8_9MARC